MADEFVGSWNPADFFRESGLGYERGMATALSGDMGGLSLPKLADQGYTTIGRIPASLTVGTGLTFALILTDDGSNANDLGKVVRIGLTVKKVANDETTDIDTGAATESTVDITLSSTSGGLVLATKAIANAALDSVGAGDHFLLRVRRVSSATQDTCNGRVILLGITVKNT